MALDIKEAISNKIYIYEDYYGCPNLDLIEAKGRILTDLTQNLTQTAG